MKNKRNSLKVRIKEFFTFVLPLSLLILFVLILRFIWTVNAVDLLYVLTEGGPATSTLTLPVYIYKTLKGSLNFLNAKI
ncbi:unnamed protein product [marine sediment metagenome]|uniref:ABC transmembrane type-1 domain-containing protein n=1 Tax=marine sediment metagenome TaxID=412755 RepID=X1EPT5_9ZZZZ